MSPLLTRRRNALNRAALTYARAMPNVFQGNRELATIAMSANGALSPASFIAAECIEDLRNIERRAARNATDDGNPDSFREAASILVARIDAFLDIATAHA